MHRARLACANVWTSHASAQPIWSIAPNGAVLLDVEFIDGPKCPIASLRKKSKSRMAHHAFDLCSAAERGEHLKFLGRFFLSSSHR